MATTVSEKEIKKVKSKFTDEFENYLKKIKTCLGQEEEREFCNSMRLTDKSFIIKYFKSPVYPYAFINFFIAYSV